jgi:GDP-L-fucose synthase
VPFSLAGRKVWVAGHRGMVGSALVRRLASTGAEVLTVERRRLDLRHQANVEAWVAANRPDAIFVAAAVVGGILANDRRPVDFLQDNLQIQTNIVEAAAEYGVSKLMFLGSACIYPRLCPQPMAESQIMAGPLEPTNEWYAVAKIAGIKLCQAHRRQFGRDFIAALPTNLYGPGDNFDPEASHVVPALIRKIDAAGRAGGPVEIWGTGTPRREFLYVDDAADALVFLMENYSDEAIVNVGQGEDVSIAELAARIARVASYTGGFTFLADKPDGMPLKRLEGSRLAALGWHPKTSLDDGLRRTLDWYRGGHTIRGAA